MFSEKGYIYILSNPSFNGLYKVGKTARDPYERAKELSSATGVPTPFKIEYLVYVEDNTYAEELTHSILQQKGFRLSNNREFFNAPLELIKEIISRIGKEVKIINDKHYFEENLNPDLILLKSKKTKINSYGKTKYPKIKKLKKDFFD